MVIIRATLFLVKRESVKSSHQVSLAIFQALQDFMSFLAVRVNDYFKIQDISHKFKLEISPKDNK